MDYKAIKEVVLLLNRWRLRVGWSKLEQWRKWCGFCASYLVVILTHRNQQCGD